MPSSVSAPVLRVGGRVLLIDPDARVLPIHERIEGGQSHWLTPGGGVELGESPAMAASGDQTVRPQQLTDIEAQTLIGYRWWSVVELRATREVIEPPSPADLMERLALAASGDG